MLLTATELGSEADADIPGYIEDIDGFSGVIQQCWDREVGYFGYATHDSEGQVNGVLRDDNGVNLNMSLDGVSPLIAGACTVEQTGILLDRIFDPARMWTDIGVSSVDQSAPYFSLNGYWNGSVWMAHQWFLFKALLDIGRPELAYRIASTALNVWSTEGDRTYNCWEHFQIATGRGGGWHQFGALSAPVLRFFASYHQLGTVTAGLDTRILQARVGVDNTEADLVLKSLPNTGSQRASLVACLAAGVEYVALMDGQPVEVQEVDDGVVHVIWDSHRPASMAQLPPRHLSISPA